MENLNRVIKFRVRDIDNKRWLEEDEIMIDSDGCLLQNEVQTKKGNFVLNQYSGLNDRDEKEIYEGDLIEYTGFDKKKYIQGCPSLSNFHFWQETSDNYTVKVIGNIYENPELLKVE